MEGIMKQLQIELHNKQKLLLVEVPVGAINFRNPILELGEKPDVLGYYSPRTGEIDFQPKDEWVGYSEFHSDFKSAKHKLENLLWTETEKVFPLKENPIKEPDHMSYKHMNQFGEYVFMSDYHKNVYADDWEMWQKGESKTMPERFVVLLIK